MSDDNTVKSKLDAIDKSSLSEAGQKLYDTASTSIMTLTAGLKSSDADEVKRKLGSCVGIAKKCIGQCANIEGCGELKDVFAEIMKQAAAALAK